MAILSTLDSFYRSSDNGGKQNESQKTMPDTSAIAFLNLIDAWV